MKFTISLKIILSSLILMFLAVLMGGFSVYTSSMSDRLSSDSIEYVVPLMNDVSGASISSISAMVDAANFLDSGNINYYNSAVDFIDNANYYLDDGDRIINSAPDKAVFGDILELVPTFRQSFDLYSEAATNVMDAYWEASESNKAFYLSSTALITELQKLHDYGVVVLSAGGRNAAAYGEVVKSVSLLIGDIYDIRLDYGEAVNKKNASTLDHIIQESQSMRKNINFLKSVRIDAEYEKLLAAVVRVFDKVDGEADKVFDDIKILASASKARGSARADLQNIIDDINETAISRNIDFSMTSSETLKENQFVQIIILAIILIAGCLLTVMNIVTISRPIRHFVESVGNLTKGDGDLTAQIKAANNYDELHQLASNFNRFIKNVREIVSAVKVSADEVVDGNNRLASTMEELSSTFDSQTARIADIVSGMDSISRAAHSTNEVLAQNTKDLDTAFGETIKGREQLGKTKDSIMGINHRATALSGTISKLSESSSRIGDIIVAINEIAGQTNLLALNAAIEAARAGESGRGFAVVADEVRKLAERTQKATEEVEHIIKILQKETESASVEMGRAADSVLEGVQIVTATAEGFNKIVEYVVKVKNESAEVSGSVSAQYISIRGVDENTQNIALGINESNAAVSEVASTITQLKTRSENLKNLVEKFKI